MGSKPAGVGHSYLQTLGEGRLGKVCEFWEGEIAQGPLTQVGVLGMGEDGARVGWQCPPPWALQPGLTRGSSSDSRGQACPLPARWSSLANCWNQYHSPAGWEPHRTGISTRPARLLGLARSGASIRGPKEPLADSCSPWHSLSLSLQSPTSSPVCIPTGKSNNWRNKVGRARSGEVITLKRQLYHLLSRTLSIPFMLLPPMSSCYNLTC